MYHTHGYQCDKNDKSHNDQHSHLQHIHGQSSFPVLYLSYHRLPNPEKNVTSIKPVNHYK